MVTLMTVHTAKGLEYPVVFCTGWEDGVFPHLRALGEPKELAEERRLAYVAITRAQRRLYVSRALVRNAWGQPMSNPASRFLDEIPAELVDWRRLAPSGTQRETGTPRAGHDVGSWGRHRGHLERCAYDVVPSGVPRGPELPPERELEEQGAAQARRG